MAGDYGARSAAQRVVYCAAVDYEVLLMVGWPQFSLGSLVVVLALIPIGVGFWEGADGLSSAFLSLIPGETSLQERALDAVAPLGSAARIYFVNLIGSPGLVQMLICAALGVFRLKTAKLTAWTLIIMGPFSTALLTYFLVGSIFFNLPGYFVSLLKASVCAAAWFAARFSAKRWIWKDKSNACHEKKERLAFAGLAIMIFLISILGWDCLHSMPDMSILRSPLLLQRRFDRTL